MNDGISLADVVPSERGVGPDPGHQTGISDAESSTRTVRENVSAQVVELVFEWGVVAVRDRLNIGRDAGFSPLAGQLAKHDTVSRRHAELYVDKGALFVRHLGTTNPTYVNDRALNTNESTRLGDGDTFRFSNAVLATVRIGAVR